MRILFLTQVLPFPLDAGPKVRAYYVLRHLSRTHNVTLVSFVRPSDTQAAIDHLTQFCDELHTVPMTRSKRRDLYYLSRSLLAHRPFIIERDRMREMNSLLEQLVTEPFEPFDAIHADQLWMAPYAMLAKSHSDTTDPPLTVLDQHNAVFMIPKRIATGERNPVKRALLNLESRKLATYEADMCRQFDRVVWVTPDDRNALSDLAADRTAPISSDAIIPICGDTSHEHPIKLRPDGKRVTFLGGLHYPPNAQGVRWFCQEVFPHILRRVPDARLTIIGKLPPGGLGPVDVLPDNLEITGYVDDPKPYLAETAAFIVPLLAGGGMRVKIIDGWAWGLPIVSTSVGAEGIQFSSGQNLLIADCAHAFADATIRLLLDANERNRLAQCGRRQVVEHYDWRHAYRAWNQIYAEE